MIMAYSNWGAYIWKNGENITKQAADKGFTYISGDKKWYENAEIDDEYDFWLLEQILKKWEK